MCDSVLQAFANLSIRNGESPSQQGEHQYWDGRQEPPDFQEASQHMRQPWWHAFSVEEADRAEFKSLCAAPEFYWGTYKFMFDGTFESMRLEARVGVDRVMRVLYVTNLRFEFSHYIWGDIDCMAPSSGATERLRDLMDDLGITERHIFGVLYRKIFKIWPANDDEGIKLIE